MSAFRGKADIGKKDADGPAWSAQSLLSMP